MWSFWEWDKDRPDNYGDVVNGDHDYDAGNDDDDTFFYSPICFKSSEGNTKGYHTRIMDSAGRHRATSQLSYWTKQVGMMGPQH